MFHLWSGRTRCPPAAKLLVRGGAEVDDRLRTPAPPTEGMPVTETAPTTTTGVAAGVPYVLRRPSTPRPDAPAVVAWHLLDAPRTPEAFAAALPLAGVDGWRVYLGLPMSGARSLEPAEVARRVAADPVLQAHDPLNAQAVAEFPAAWEEICTVHGIGAGPVGLLGGSAGGGVAGAVALSGAVDVAALVLVNALVGLRAAQPVLEQLQGRPYTWSPASEAAADRMDLVARAPEFGDTPVRLIVGADDHPDAIVAPARALAAAVRVGDLVEIPGLAHPLAAEPGVAPARQWHLAGEVDRFASEWLARHTA